MSFNAIINYKIFYKISFILIIYIISKVYGNYKIDWSDFNLTTPQIIESRNFQSETHFITTSDGYILQIFRIINPYLKNNGKYLKPIILQHGFCSDSDEFLISRKGYLRDDGNYIEDGMVTDCINYRVLGKTLGFVLSSCGYDVWLSNLRGNRYTQNHTTIDPIDTQFWKFTFDELALIDLPAIINYIGVRTQDKRIGYIGYSIGTTIMFALMASKPVYSSLIDPFVAIAPIVYISNSVFVSYKILYPLFRTFAFPLIRSPSLRQIILKIWNKELPAEDSYVNEMAAHLIGRTSSLIVAHLLQMMANNNFAHFDWGFYQNYIRYGTLSPPEYPISNITSNRIALIQTKEDVFSDYKDIQRLKSVLKVKLLLDYWIPDRNWTHSDYLFNKNTDIYVNLVIMKLLLNSK